MHILYECIPLKTGKRSVDVSKSENVKSFRKTVATDLDTEPANVRLFALGKMLMDHTADGKLSKLFMTYRIKENTLVHVQISQGSAKIMEEEEPKEQEQEETKDPKEAKGAEKSKEAPTTISDTNEQGSGGVKQDKCTVCNDDDKIKECRECGCVHCLKKSGDPLICDQCEGYWHLECVGLTSVPEEDDWYCPLCINTDVDVVISSGKAVDMSNFKVAKSKGAKTSRSWGGGTSCSGRTSECVIVPKDHVGAIPGVHCGQSWLYRMQASEWGVHRPPVGGIAGTESSGAVSIVLSKGYEDDADNGDEFYYTGSGGRDLSNNKRTGDHATDQELTRFNLALAKTCAAEIDKTKGGKAADWKQSRPIRVCRTYALAKHHPKYAPEEGVRYDGLYKVVKFWQEKGKSGFKVWRYLMRRDDPEPAPWTAEGKELMKKRGLRMIMPEGQKSEERVQYRLPKKVIALMEKDEADKRVWDDLRSAVFWSEYEFLHYLFSEVAVCSSGACSVPIRVSKCSEQC
ncbi:PUA-like domain-containing protein [Fennellomyces sp. T-0311]|nr:PUA-like domain-containing protein [Fennellomyces sp. T-0311]